MVVAVVIFIGTKPFIEKTNIYLEYFNEIIIMFVIYNMICFTAFVPDPEVKFNLGYMTCGLIAFHILVSFIFMGKTTFKNLKISFFK